MHQLEWDEDEIATRVKPAFDPMRTQVMTSAARPIVTRDEPSLAGMALPEAAGRPVKPRYPLGWLIALALLSAFVAREGALYMGLARKAARVESPKSEERSEGASLYVDGAHEGITVAVDGVPRGMLPVTLDDLEAGTHRLRFEAGPRFVPVEHSVALLSGERIDFGRVALELRTGQVRVEVTPEQSQVWLRGEEGAARALTGPRTLELAPGDYELIVARRGYRSVVRPLRVDATRPEQVLRISLKPTDWARDDIWEQ
jgi:hypothetical protein